MIQLNIIYPRNGNAIFDWDYYLNIHMPLSIRLHGEALKEISISKGIEDIAAAPASYIAITCMLFDSVEAFMGSIYSTRETLQGDMKNYTNITPVIQFSEVVL